MTTAIWIEPDSVTYERPIVIGDNVWLGKNAIVLPGVTIGSGSVIAANSVVSRDIPPNSLAAGFSRQGRPDTRYPAGLDALLRVRRLLAGPWRGLVSEAGPGR